MRMSGLQVPLIITKTLVKSYKTLAKLLRIHGCGYMGEISFQFPHEKGRHPNDDWENGINKT